MRCSFDSHWQNCFLKHNEDDYCQSSFGRLKFNQIQLPSIHALHDLGLIPNIGTTSGLNTYLKFNVIEYKQINGMIKLQLSLFK